MNANVSVDQQSLKQVTDYLRAIGGNLPKAQSRAINRTLTGVVTDTAREVGRVLNLAQKDIKEHITVPRKASVSRLSGEVLAKGRWIPLIKFRGTRGVKGGGVSVQVKKSKGPKILRHAFLARMKSGHLGVFMRRDPAAKYVPSSEIGAGKPIGQPASETYFTFPGAWPTEYRLPIYEPKSTDVVSVVKDQWSVIERKAAERLLKNLNQSISGMVKQKGYVIEAA